jgi:DNA-binding GntR family transcriptional regulator
VRTGTGRGEEDLAPADDMTTPTLHINQPRAPDEQSLSDRAYYAIRELIVTLELAPGSVVSERELMEQLGVGRTPVREALRDLAREQLVEVFPRRGIFVSGVEVGDIAGLSEVRLVLESKAARLAAERRNDDDRVETERLLDELSQTTGDHDERRLIDLDQRIHRHVYHCTHNPFLQATLEEYYVLTLRIWFLALDRVERLDDAIHEHHAILEAIRDRAPDRAEEVMRAQAFRRCAPRC